MAPDLAPEAPSHHKIKAPTFSAVHEQGDEHACPYCGQPCWCDWDEGKCRHVCDDEDEEETEYDTRMKNTRKDLLDFTAVAVLVWAAWIAIRAMAGN